MGMNGRSSHTAVNRRKANGETWWKIEPLIPRAVGTLGTMTSTLDRLLCKIVCRDFSVCCFVASLLPVVHLVAVIYLLK